jgi:hypothetical protein
VGTHRPAIEKRQLIGVRTGRLQVLATTKSGTRAALLEAKHLARRLNVDRVVLIVPQTAAEGALADDYRLIAHQTGIAVTIRLCVCSGYHDLLRRMLPRRSVVVVGGRRRWWWPTREQRIVDQLRSRGHEAVFAEASGASRETE